jgi:hypothetical protein
VKASGIHECLGSYFFFGVGEPGEINFYCFYCSFAVLLLLLILGNTFFAGAVGGQVHPLSTCMGLNGSR